MEMRLQSTNKLLMSFRQAPPAGCRPTSNLHRTAPKRLLVAVLAALAFGSQAILPAHAETQEEFLKMCQEMESQIYSCLTPTCYREAVEKLGSEDARARVKNLDDSKIVQLIAATTAARAAMGTDDFAITDASITDTAVTLKLVSNKDNRWKSGCSLRKEGGSWRLGK